MRIDTQGRLLSHLKESFQNISTQQNVLAEVREQVLVEREDMFCSAEAFRKQRDRCAAVESKLMDAFREHLFHMDSNIPQAVLDAYSAVETERNKLVELEDEHVHITQNLGVSEWKLADLERDLYQFHLQQLLPDNNEESPIESQQPQNEDVASSRCDDTLSSNAEYEAALVVYRRLTRSYDDLRRRYSESFDISSEGLHTRLESHDMLSMYERDSNGLLESIMEYEVKIQRLRNGLAFHEDAMERASRVYSCSEKASTHIREAGDSPLQAQSDGIVVHHVSDTLTAQRVQDWLMHRLRSSPLEQSQYMAFLMPLLAPSMTKTTAFWYWESQVILFWFCDTTPVQGELKHSPSLWEEKNFAEKEEEMEDVIGIKIPPEGIERLLYADVDDRLQISSLPLSPDTHDMTSQPTKVDHEELGKPQTEPILNVEGKANYTTLPPLQIVPADHCNELNVLPEAVTEVLDHTQHPPPRHDSAQNFEQDSRQSIIGEMPNLSVTRRTGVVRSENSRSVLENKPQDEFMDRPMNILVSQATQALLRTPAEHNQDDITK